MDPDFRRAALVRRIRKLDADILCLQEVEVPIYEHLLESLGDDGYQGRFMQREPGQLDGCATLVRGLPEPEWSELRFHDGQRGQADSGHVALTVAFALAGRRLAVANTHLKWDPPGVSVSAQWSSRQMSELIEFLKTLGSEGTVVCGDFNAEARDDAVRQLRQAGYREAFDGEQSSVLTVVTGKKARKIDYLFYSPKLKVRAFPMGSLRAETALPSAEEPSDHIPLIAEVDWTGGGRKKG